MSFLDVGDLIENVLIESDTHFCYLDASDKDYMELTQISITHAYVFRISELRYRSYYVDYYGRNIVRVIFEDLYTFYVNVIVSIFKYTHTQFGGIHAKRQSST